jgi:hypothetical protein
VHGLNLQMDRSAEPGPKDKAFVDCPTLQEKLLHLEVNEQLFAAQMLQRLSVHTQQKLAFASA